MKFPPVLPTIPTVPDDNLEVNIVWISAFAIPCGRGCGNSNTEKTAQ